MKSRTTLHLRPTQMFVALAISVGIPAKANAQQALPNPVPQESQGTVCCRLAFSSGNRIAMIATAMPAGTSERE